MILPCISLDHEAMPKHGICPSGAPGRQAGLSAGAGLVAFATRQASAKERTTGGMTAGRQSRKPFDDTSLPRSARPAALAILAPPHRTLEHAR